jgi:hypothetical protein
MLEPLVHFEWYVRFVKQMVVDREYTSDEMMNEKRISNLLSHHTILSLSLSLSLSVCVNS